MNYIRLAVPAPGFPKTSAMVLLFLIIVAFSLLLLLIRKQYNSLWRGAFGSHLLLALSLFFPLGIGPWATDISGYAIVTWSLHAGDWVGFVPRCVPQLLGLALFMAECVVIICGFNKPLVARRRLYFWTGMTVGCVVILDFLVRAFDQSFVQAVRLLILLLCVAMLFVYRLFRDERRRAAILLLTFSTWNTLVVGMDYKWALPEIGGLLMYAGILLGMYEGARSLFWQSTQHDADGAPCGNCGYDIRGNVSGVCSECGRPLPSPSDKATSELVIRDRSD